ncbi:peptidyl-alpha-hydroxyglycine alpha-amidating lyase family protein [Sphingomonas sp. MMS12-HWE2-04]|uniref:peptidyl-alpha-hydroxyglycine alpha-amidating lyase family protein n=1 Tax=Sphingomonas sp. MMS12-HWE2-04 TaxID=3234199 RepID=UPI00384F1FF6
MLRGLALLVVAALLPGPVSAQAAPDYRVVHGWPQLPEGLALGAVAGVGVDSKGLVWVFQRAGRQWTDPLPSDPIAAPTVVAFDGETGKIANAWGDGRFVMPHGLSVDAQDNIWLTDVALHQVFKFSPEGKLLLSLGEAGVPGTDGKHFNRPTDIAVLPDGSFYVSDGYINSRVAKFAPDGRFLFEWGVRGTATGAFDLPHGLAVDAQGRVYVADRENDRIQRFDGRGKFLDAWKSPEMGRPYGIALLPGGMAAVIDGGEQPKRGRDRSAVAILRPDGSVAARFGRYGNYDGQFQQGHDIAADARGNLFVVDIGGERVQKFERIR